MNKIIVIGFLGNRRVYLNVPREEAIRRWKTDEGDEDFKESLVTEIEFGDEFCTYDVWEVSK